jgi:TPR repeat protein
MAAGLFMRAAEEGHVLAQILTASNCLDGCGGLESVCGSTGPTRWIKLAAYQNWPKAMVYLATVMKRRDFRGENQVRGMIWLNMAAEEGDPDGQYELAKVFLDGSFELGVSSDREMGRRWLEIAAGN